MKRLLLPMALLLAAPAAAEENKLAQGFSLLSEAARLMMEGLSEELDPALEGLKGWLEDLNAYEAPEVLPNGDIIIRRKPASDTPEEGEVEL